MYCEGLYYFSLMEGIYVFFNREFVYNEMIFIFLNYIFFLLYKYYFFSLKNLNNVFLFCFINFLYIMKIYKRYIKEIKKNRKSKVYWI